MSKYATSDARVKPRLRTVLGTDGLMWTHEGGLGASRDPKSELFILAISYLAEATFYESAEVREQRLSLLVHQVTQDDPDWVAALVPWLRHAAHLRSVAVAIACEYVAAGGTGGRRVIASACARADEPGEVLGYWLSRFGRTIPKPVKRGLADAAVRLYTERSMLRYDGSGQAIRFADVIDLAHPVAKDAEQNCLFRYALDRRHGHADPLASYTGIYEGPALEMLAADEHLRGIPAEGDFRRNVLRTHADLGPDGDLLAKAGWSWERLAGWLPVGMDRAAWEAIIPTMGYMALLRNLRNFDATGVSDEVAARVITKLSDPGEVAESRQLPIRFFSALKEAGSLRWAYALEQALDLSLGNVPKLAGETLILIDTSASMQSALSAKGSRMRYEVAALFGGALAQRSRDATLVLYATGSEEIPHRMPLLRLIEQVGAGIGRVGHGTETFAALERHWSPRYQRVIILTDEQAHAGRITLPIPLIYTFNLGGYRPAQMEEGPGRYTIGGGLSDSTFQLLSLLDARKPGVWPHLYPRASAVDLEVR